MKHTNSVRAPARKAFIADRKNPLRSFAALSAKPALTEYECRTAGRGGAVLTRGAYRRDVCRNADAFTAGKAQLPIKLRRRKRRTDETRPSHQREERSAHRKSTAAPPLKRCTSVKPTASRNTVHTGKIRRAPPKKQKEKRRRNSVFPLTLYVIAVDKSGFGSQPFPRAADPRPQDDPSGGIQLSNDGRQIRGWQSRQLGLTP